MPRFVILSHDHPFAHWDLMLETRGSLRTWRLLQSPDLSARIEAEALADHRLYYLDYEGPVSGDRGEVTQWDRGDYSALCESPERLAIELHGQRLSGRYVLDRRDDQRWTFFFAED